MEEPQRGDGWYWEKGLKEEIVLLEVRVDLDIGDVPVPEGEGELGDVFIYELDVRAGDEVAVLVIIESIAEGSEVLAVELEGEWEGDGELVDAVKELDQRGDSLFLWTSKPIRERVPHPHKLLINQGLEPLYRSIIRAQQQLDQRAQLRRSVTPIRTLNQYRVPVLHLQRDLLRI